MAKRSVWLVIDDSDSRCGKLSLSLFLGNTLFPKEAYDIVQRAVKSLLPNGIRTRGKQQFAQNIERFFPFEPYHLQNSIGGQDVQDRAKKQKSLTEVKGPCG